MNEDDSELEAAKPLVIQHVPDTKKIVAFFGGSEDNPLQAAEVTEKDLEELSGLMLELDALTKLVEMKKSDLKRIANGAETLQRGNFVALFKTTKGRSTFDNKRFIADKIGKLTEDDIKKYSAIGDPVIKFEGIRRLK